jgi:hypothetical protein
MNNDQCVLMAMSDRFAATKTDRCAAKVIDRFDAWAKSRFHSC